MDVANSLSIPRAKRLLAAWFVSAACDVADAVGDCVYVLGDRVGGLYQVRKADPLNAAKMPAVGIITVKHTTTTCEVAISGLVEGTYAGLTAWSQPLYVGADGRLTPNTPYPTAGQTMRVQRLAVVMASNVVEMARSAGVDYVISA